MGWYWVCDSEWRRILRKSSFMELEEFLLLWLLISKAKLNIWDSIIQLKLKNFYKKMLDEEEPKEEEEKKEESKEKGVITE